MESLTVTAALAGVGVVSDGRLPLDSILAWSRWSSSGRSPIDAAPDLGDILETREIGGQSLYACSFGDAEWAAEGKSFRHKRLPIRQIQRRTTAISANFAAGPTRILRIPDFYLVAPEIHWYCVGDANAIRSLLSNVSSVGKMRAHGWGVVHKWTVEPCAEDRSTVWQGRAMRALPIVEGVVPEAEGEIGWYGVRPAYWDPRNQMDVLMPELQLCSQPSG